jgi:protein TonB
VIRKADPEYTEAARAARIQGTVSLDVIVKPDGTAEVIRVSRSLEPGLDAKAMENVRQYRFRPAEKDGRAVPAKATVEIRFHL